MHMRGEPTTMNQLDQYDDVTLDVMLSFNSVWMKLCAGVKLKISLIDPGFGFAKNAQQNLSF
jgi:dihydropteroate synthase